MTNTTYYNLNIVEGTDIVNPLTVDNPNYEKIDETMHNNAVAGVTLATEIANATVHAITRENSDCAVIRFIATSRWKAGDTATVDGVPVTALLPSGETLPDGAYVINANVLCILTGTNLTVYVEGNKVENASDIVYNDTNVKAELDALNGSVEQINASVQQINGSVEQINSNLMKLLWSNGNVDSDFASQTITLETSDFDYLDVYITDNAGGETSIKCHRVLKGTTLLATECYVRSNALPLILQRSIISSFNTVKFGAAAFSTTNSTGFKQGNNYMKPLYIYGGKFVR